MCREGDTPAVLSAELLLPFLLLLQTRTIQFMQSPNQ
jgi:hypothetical protein